MAITYCLVCNITGEKYYGSSEKTLEVRMKKHKCKRNTCVSRQIIERGDYDIYQLCKYDTIEEAKMKEKWYIDNKECINERRVRLTEEQKRQYDKEYKEQNKDIINEKKKLKITCECGSVIRKCEFYRHCKTKKHKSFFNN